MGLEAMMSVVEPRMYLRIGWGKKRRERETEEERDWGRVYVRTHCPVPHRTEG
jgi:hypothetical protein